MKPASLSTIRWTLGAWSVLVMAPALVATVVGYGPRASGPDSTGSLPKASGSSPVTPPVIRLAEVATPTLGVVLDVHTRLPVVGVLVIVTNALGEPVAVAVTDKNGRFVVNLFDDPDLELAIPSEGIAGIEIHAGEALCVIVS